MSFPRHPRLVDSNQLRNANYIISIDIGIKHLAWTTFNMKEKKLLTWNCKDLMPELTADELSGSQPLNVNRIKTAMDTYVQCDLCVYNWDNVICLLEEQFCQNTNMRRMSDFIGMYMATKGAHIYEVDGNSKLKYVNHYSILLEKGGGYTNKKTGCTALVRDVILMMLPSDMKLIYNEFVTKNKKRDDLCDSLVQLFSAMEEDAFFLVGESEAKSMIEDNLKKFNR